MFDFKNLFAKVPLQEEDREHKELPPEMVSSLTQAIENLPVPSEYTKPLQSSLEEALTAWQEEEDASNELIILSNPVEPLLKIIQETINNWQPPDEWKIKSLSFSTRPDNFSNISEILESDLGLDAEPDFKEKSSKLKQLIVIPSLEFCFLRQIYGLDGIEYLKELIFKDNSHFWVIGCNNLAWEYLDYVDKITAYFEHTITLPQLEGSQLQEKLMPILADANIKLNWDGESTEEREKKLKSHFDRLADTSEGSLSVAAQLWWRSLGLPDTEENAEEKDNPVDNNVVKLDKIKLPELPSGLTPEDRYLLFSLLLHQKMTLEHLTLSLGDFESTIQFQLQKLLQTGIIRRKGLFFSVHPAHFYRLKKYLKQNNFITGI
ncbi:MAG: hypothetical protein SXA11_13650 [Cyanobacteriota bacterium]|nr:hypothetical protein [Cyanobacteriota bacterium]